MLLEVMCLRKMEMQLRVQSASSCLGSTWEMAARRMWSTCTARPMRMENMSACVMVRVTGMLLKKLPACDFASSAASLKSRSRFGKQSSLAQKNLRKAVGGKGKLLERPLRKKTVLGKMLATEKYGCRKIRVYPASAATTLGEIPQNMAAPNPSF